MEALEKLEVVSGEVLDDGVKRCDCGWRLPANAHGAQGSFDCPECGEHFVSYSAAGPRPPSQLALPPEVT